MCVDMVCLPSPALWLGRGRHICSSMHICHVAYILDSVLSMQSISILSLYIRVQAGPCKAGNRPRPDGKCRPPLTLFTISIVFTKGSHFASTRESMYVPF